MSFTFIKLKVKLDFFNYFDKHTFTISAQTIKTVAFIQKQ